MSPPTYVLSERNLVEVLRQHEAGAAQTFGRIEDGIASLAAGTEWRLCARLETYGIDKTMRHAWDRRNAKRRCRRGRLGEGRGLPWDAWVHVIASSSPERVLMLGMTCKALRDAIRGDHGLWCRLFVRWEYKTGGRRVISFPDFVNPMRRPQGVPREGWQSADVVDRGAFNAVARKIVALQYAPCCGLCGQTRRKTDPVWALGVRVCSNCWRGNLVSNHVLYHRYGLELVKPVDRGGDPRPFVERCLAEGVFGFVFKVRFWLLFGSLFGFSVAAHAAAHAVASLWHPL